MELAAVVLAVVKAIPALQKIFEAAIDLYNQQQDIAAENQSIKVQREREATVAAMKQPGLTDQQRATLRRRLWELGKL
jgi:predicted DNA binding protein